MRARTAVALVTTVVALKAVLIGAIARGRCELIGRCGDGTAWYLGCAVAAGILVVLLVVTIVGARRDVLSRRQ